MREKYVAKRITAIEGRSPSPIDYQHFENEPDARADARYPSVTNIEETPPAARRFAVDSVEDEEEEDFPGDALEKQDASSSFQYFLDNQISRLENRIQSTNAGIPTGTDDQEALQDQGHDSADGDLASRQMLPTDADWPQADTLGNGWQFDDNSN